VPHEPKNESRTLVLRYSYQNTMESSRSSVSQVVVQRARVSGNRFLKNGNGPNDSPLVALRNGTRHGQKSTS